MGRFAVIEAGKVINHAEADAGFASQLGWVPAGDSKIGDTWDGSKFKTGPKPPIAIEDVQQAVQDRLDDFARTEHYDGILSACTYATSTVPRFKAQGQYCVGARDLTWGTCYAILDEITTGQRPMPTSVSEVLDDLPLLEWPQ